MNLLCITRWGSNRQAQISFCKRSSCRHVQLWPSLKRARTALWTVRLILQGIQGSVSESLHVHGFRLLSCSPRPRQKLHADQCHRRSDASIAMSSICWLLCSFFPTRWFQNARQCELFCAWLRFVGRHEGLSHYILASVVSENGSSTKRLQLWMELNGRIKGPEKFFFFFFWTVVGHVSSARWVL